MIPEDCGAVGGRVLAQPEEIIAFVCCGRSLEQMSSRPIGRRMSSFSPPDLRSPRWSWSRLWPPVPHLSPTTWGIRRNSGAELSSAAGTRWRKRCVCCWETRLDGRRSETPGRRFSGSPWNGARSSISTNGSTPVWSVRKECPCMAAEPPEVSAVVLTWNSANHIPRALAALSRQARDIPSEIIVIDNGSTDGSPELVRACAPDAQVIRYARNLGVARARNRGIALARGRFVLLLDIDTEMHAGSLSTLVCVFSMHPMVGIAGPRLVSPDGTVQFSCRRFPTVQGKLLRQLPARVRMRFPLVADEELHHIDRSV